jgi:hypothetical protein
MVSPVSQITDLLRTEADIRAAIIELGYLLAETKGFHAPTPIASVLMLTDSTVYGFPEWTPAKVRGYMSKYLEETEFMDEVASLDNIDFE